MTKLTRLLKELEAANHDDSPTGSGRYEQAKRDLAWWVHRLWREGRLDSEAVKMEGAK
jgi:hypothetical protein